MTEEEWVKCADPELMLRFLGTTPRRRYRKLRLFACACCRRIWHRLNRKPHQEIVEVAERFVDGRASELEMRVAGNTPCIDPGTHLNTTFDIRTFSAESAAGYTAITDPCNIHEYSTYSARLVSSSCQRAADVWYLEQKSHAELLRCIFGPLLHRPVTLKPEWFTPTVTGLATMIYEERQFDKLSRLGEALEEAGCQQEDILKHLGNSGEHCRGCWALDLMLGKE